jgi:hypothetical protein
VTGLLRQYNKGVRAFIGSVFLWLYAAKDGGISGDEWWGLAFIVAVTAGVIDATNTPRPEHRQPVERWGDRGAVEPGSFALGLLLGAVFVYFTYVR